MALLLIAGCVTKTDVVQVDLTRNQGAYVLAYTTNVEVRRTMEDQLVKDLAARGIVAHASHLDLSDVSVTTRDSVVAAANARRVIAILVIRQVTGDANSISIAERNADLSAFYDGTRALAPSIERDQTVVAQVDAYLVDGNKTRLTWSGASWSFKADGAGTAIRGMSAAVADALVQIRDTYID